jgi:hypothetical protein
MRISHGKSRTPLPPDMTADNTASGVSKGNHPSSSHDSTFTSYGASELTPVTSASSAATASDLDVNALTDDELRERFKSVMVCLCIFQNRKYYIFSSLRMIYSKEMKQKRKCLNKQHQRICVKCLFHIINLLLYV